MTEPPIRLVTIESPYAGTGDTPEAVALSQALHAAYIRACLRDSLKRGEAPLASHATYTLEGVLDDDDPLERLAGMFAGIAWKRRADATIVYTDLGISDGMKQGIAAAEQRGQPVEYRTLGDDWKKEHDAVVAAMRARRAGADRGRRTGVPNRLIDPFDQPGG